MKKLVLLLVVVTPAIFLMGCFGGTSGGSFAIQGNAPQEYEIIGRWQMVRHQYRGTDNATYGNNHAFVMWSYIEFNENGTFSESTPWGGINSGTWTQTDGHNFILTATTNIQMAGLVFVGSRRIGIDGETLHMNYTRSQQGATWHYRMEFTRV